MKIYLAGSCSSEHRTLMQRIAKHLKSLGYIVYCPFELQIPDAWKISQEAWSYEVFRHDIDALDDCDIFFMITPGRISSAGTNWEQGYAYAKEKRIIVLQITPEHTSLMTFCGSNVFVNADLSDLEHEIEVALRKTTSFPTTCKTILT